MSEITYRPFEDKDRDAVLSLFDAAFGKPRDAGQWSWEFMGGPEPAVIVVAESEGKVVGHYAVLPRKFRVGASVVKSGLVVDVMTHPQYGKRGIFVNSGLEAFKQAKEKGIKMLIGFPNEAAIKGHQKVGWSELGTVAVFARPLKASSVKSFLGDRVKIPFFVVRVLDVLLRALNKISVDGTTGGLAASWVSATELSSTQDRIEDLRSGFTESYPVCNTRAMDWMSWRFSDPLAPTHILLLQDEASRNLVGLGALKVKDKDGIKTGAVMDLMARNADSTITTRLLRELIRKAVVEGCELMIIFGSPASAREGLLRRLFVFKTPRKLRFIVRSVVEEPLPEEVFELGKWHLELIDHDVM